MSATTPTPADEGHGMRHIDPELYHRRIARPPVRPGFRIPTRALLVTDDGQEQVLTSGADGRYFAHAVRLAQETGFVDIHHVPEFAAHVEMKAAVWMQLHERQDVNLITNSITCVGPLGCNTALSRLPPVWCRRPPSPSARPMIAAYFRHNHDEAPVIVQDRKDILDLLDSLANQPFDHSLAALYVMSRTRNNLGLPDHELRVGVDGERGQSALRYMGEFGTWQSHGRHSDREEVCFYYMGNDTPFPIASEIPLDRAADAIQLFLSHNGSRPENIAWTPVDQPPPMLDAETKDWWNR